MIIEAVLLEKATLLERIQYLSCRDHRNVTAKNGHHKYNKKQCVQCRITEEMLYHDLALKMNNPKHKHRTNACKSRSHRCSS